MSNLDPTTFKTAAKEIKAAFSNWILLKNLKENSYLGNASHPAVYTISLSREQPLPLKDCSYHSVYIGETTKQLRSVVQSAWPASSPSVFP